MSIFTIQGAAEILARQWQALYRTHPKTTVAITLVASVAVGAVVYVMEKASAERREAARQKNLSYSAQASKLDETRSNLESLLQFVEDERSRLSASESALQALKSEQERLRPLVESDRSTINALFAEQEARNQAAQSSERWIGFGLGVLSSLVASFAWAFFSFLRRKGLPKLSADRN